MSVDSQEFRVVLQGYETAQADAIKQAVLSYLDQVDDETVSLRENPSVSIESGHKAFGQRLTSILELAEEEASEIRSVARARAEELRIDVEQTTTQLRADADAFASKRTDDAEAFASKLVSDAEATAEKLLGEATREAEEMRNAASTVLDEQREKAAEAEVAFEKEFTTRREEAEATLRAVLADHQERMHDLDEHLEKRRVEGERRHQDALAASRSILEDAHTRSDAIVAEATETAENIRTENEREVAVITEQRDSINAQLTNVREMLASLTGGAAVPME